jgi:uncharacterized membrane protein
MKTKIFKETIFWLSYIGIIYLIFLIGQESFNPLKWGYVNYDNIHGMPIGMRLIGMFVSLCILTVLFGLIDKPDYKGNIKNN